MYLLFFSLDNLDQNFMLSLSNAFLSYFLNIDIQNLFCSILDSVLNISQALMRYFLRSFLLSSHSYSFPLLLHLFLLIFLPSSASFLYFLSFYLPFFPSFPSFFLWLPSLFFCISCRHYIPNSFCTSSPNLYYLRLF